MKKRLKMKYKEYVRENNKMLKPHGLKIVSTITYSIFIIYIILLSSLFLYLIYDEKFVSNIVCGNASLDCNLNCPDLKCPDLECPDVIFEDNICDFPNNINIIIKNETEN